jgi:hypothetical protein
MLHQSVITDLKAIIHRKYYDYDIKSRVVMAKVVFRKKILFPQKLDVNWRMELVKFYIWSVDFHGTKTWALRKIEQK